MDMFCDRVGDVRPKRGCCEIIGMFSKDVAASGKCPRAHGERKWCRTLSRGSN
jgi:hypothetical protein